MNVAMLRVLIAVLVLWPALALGQSFPRKYDSAASTNATLVAGGYAQVRVIAVTNTVATVYYLKLYDKSTAPVCGTDVVVYKTALPASTAFVVPIPDGLAFQNGLGFCITAAIADSDTTVAATGITVNFGVKQ